MVEGALKAVVNAVVSDNRKGESLALSQYMWAHQFGGFPSKVDVFVPRS